jgi:thiopurine S-methyltransferase
MYYYRWRSRWQAGQTNWHRTEPYPVLVKHYDRWLGSAPTASVLVPLCGKTVDMPWLARKGHEVVGVEGVESAVWELQRDSWLNFSTAQVTQADGAFAAGFTAAAAYTGSRPGYVFKTGEQGLGYYKDQAGLKVFTDKRLPLKVLVGDFFEMSTAELGSFQACLDRGSLVAIPPHARQQYVRLINSLLAVGGTVLLITTEYNQRLLEGPPYSLSKAAVESLYCPLGFKVELLGQEDAKSEYKCGKWDSVPVLHENTFLITKLRDVDSSSSSGGKRWYKPWTWLRAA